MSPRSFVESLLGRVASTVNSLQKQAPGARMIGELAVKQSLKEVNKNLQNLHGNKSSPADIKKVHDDKP